MDPNPSGKAFPCPACADPRGLVFESSTTSDGVILTPASTGPIETYYDYRCRSCGAAFYTVDDELPRATRVLPL